MKNVERRAYQTVAFGRIKEGRVDYRIGYRTDTYRRGGVNAYHFGRKPAAASYFGGSDGHTVVVGINQVDFGVQTQNGVGRARGIFIVPVSGCGSSDLNAGIARKHLGKSKVTLHCRSRARIAVNLQHTRLRPDEMSGITCGHAPELGVVHPLVGGVVGTVDVAVKHYHGGAALIGFLHNGSDGVGLVGRRYDNVEPVVEKILYVGNLFLIGIIGRAYLQLSIRMKHYLALHLLVHLRAPVVVRALRHTYPVSPPLASARKERRRGKGYQEHTYDFISEFHGYGFNQASGRL